MWKISLSYESLLNFKRICLQFGCKIAFLFNFFFLWYLSLLKKMRIKHRKWQIKLQLSAITTHIQQNSHERTKTTWQISSQLMLTIVSEPSSGHISPSWIFSNALVGACIFLLEVRNFKHTIELPQFNFAGKWHPITSSPINLRNRADQKIVKSVAAPWKSYRLKNRKL